MVDELVPEAKAAKRAEAAYERHKARVRELLPLSAPRTSKKYGPAVLEAMILNVYERGTISRMTAEAIGHQQEGPGRAEAVRRLPGRHLTTQRSPHRLPRCASP